MSYMALLGTPPRSGHRQTYWTSSHSTPRQPGPVAVQIGKGLKMEVHHVTWDGTTYRWPDGSEAQGVECWTRAHLHKLGANIHHEDLR